MGVDALRITLFVVGRFGAAILLVLKLDLGYERSEGDNDYIVKVIGLADSLMPLCAVDVEI